LATTRRGREVAKSKKGVDFSISPAGQDDYVRWTRNIHDELSGKLTKTHGYHLIPTSGYGSNDTNYAETLFRPVETICPQSE
jgi:hypothetical protein